MSVIKTSCLVLKYVNLNDNDRIFTLYSDEIGKISALSKGIRSHKHKDFAALQLFCYIDVVLDDSKGLYYINSADIKENFYNLRLDVKKTALASYFTDLVSFISDEIRFDKDFFTFVLNSLYLVSNAEKRAEHDIDSELLRLKTVFETKCVCACGYMPDALYCKNCGSLKELVNFDTVHGCAVCKNCIEKYMSPEIFEASENSVKIIGYVSNADYKSSLSFKASDECIERANEISERYLINKLEYVSKMLEYYKSL